MNKAVENILERLDVLIEESYYEATEGSHNAGIRNNAYHEVKKIVQEVAEEYNGGWISCSSGNMPSNGQKVYVEFNDGKHMCLVYRTKDSRDKSNGWEMNITQDGFYEICSDYGYMPYINIIAWQPLPEPYKESD